jgi:hypothetical protein
MIDFYCRCQEIGVTKRNHSPLQSHHTAAVETTITIIMMIGETQIPIQMIEMVIQRKDAADFRAFVDVVVEAEIEDRLIATTTEKMEVGDQTKIITMAIMIGDQMIAETIPIRVEDFAEVEDVETLAIATMKTDLHVDETMKIMETMRIMMAKRNQNAKSTFHQIPPRTKMKFSPAALLWV